MSAHAHSAFQDNAAVAERPAPTKTAPQRATWEEMQAEAKAESIRRGVYNPGAGGLNPLYEKDPAKRLAMADAFRAKFPGPFSDSASYIRRCRDSDLGGEE